MAPFGSLGSFSGAIRRLTPTASASSMDSAEERSRTSHIADIWRSAEEGDGRAILAYYDAGGQVDRRHHETHWTPLAIASRRGNLAAVRELIALNADLEKEMEYQYTALLLAANCGSDRLPCPHAGEVEGVCPHLHIAEALVNAGANVNAQTDQKFTALGMAALYGQVSLVKTLLVHGADLEHRNPQNFTSLALAAQGGQLDVARLLLDGGAALEPRTDIGITPLGVAAQEGHDVIVKEFLARGAEVEARDTEGNTPLMLAADYGHTLVVELLMNHEAMLEVADSQGCTALHLAAREGHTAIVERLIASGSDVCSRDHTQRTPLMAAAQNAHYDACRLLLEAGAAIDDVSDGGMTALIWAARGGGDNRPASPPLLGSVSISTSIATASGSIDIIGSRSSKGVSSNIGDVSNNNNNNNNNGSRKVKNIQVLGSGVVGGSSEIGSSIAISVMSEELWSKQKEELKKKRISTIQCLLEAGAYVFARTLRGNTALMTACISGNAEVIAPLLEASVGTARRSGSLLGADALETGKAGDVRDMGGDGGNAGTTVSALLSTPNSQGFTALLLACQGNHAELAYDLVNRGASITCCTKEGYTPLLLAAEKGMVDLVQQLLGKGADLNARQQTGDTALQLAAYFGYPEVVELLLKKGADKNVADEDGDKPGETFDKGVGVTARVKVTALLYGEAAAATLHSSWQASQGSQAASFLASDDENKESSETERRSARRTSGSNGSLSRTSGETTYNSHTGDGSTTTTTTMRKAGDSQPTTTTSDARYRRSSTPNVFYVDHNAQRKWTRLHIAAYNGDAVEVAKLVKLGAACEQKIEHNFTALMVACQANKPDIVKLLLEIGAKLEAVSDRGFTPLLVAAKNGHVEVAKMLLAKGANYGAQNDRGFTALLLASQNGDIGLVQLLVESPSFSADILEAATDQGFTPLLAACRHGHDEVVKLLLAKGADAHAVNKAKCNALHLACELGSVKVLTLLLEHSLKQNNPLKRLDLEGKTATQDTALSIAAYFGNASSVRLLRSYGANSDTKDEDGSKPGECFDEDLSEDVCQDVLLALQQAVEIKAGHLKGDSKGGEGGGMTMMKGEEGGAALSMAEQ